MADLVNINDLYENAPCGYFSFLPESGKVIKANKTFLSLVGVDQSEVENLHFVDLLHKGNMIYYEMIFLPSIKMHGFINEISFDILKKDGTRFPGLINAAAVTDEQNNLIGVNAILLEISERKKYEQELLSSKTEAEKEHAKFEVLSNQLPAIIWTANDSGNIDFLNKQYLIITRNKEILHNSHISDLIDERDASSFQEKWEEAQTKNSIFEMHVRLKNQSNKDDWYLLRGIPYVQDISLIGQARSWLGTLTNINYQIQSLQIKDDFISIASHELKTPLTVVKSSLQLLQNIASDPVQAKLIEKSERAVKLMQQLINSLLDISAISLDKIPIDTHKENLIDIINACITSYKEGKNDHKIDLRGDSDPVYVLVDRMRMEQVLNNLIDNAVKYSPDADRVIIRLTKNSDSGKVTISVEDFGRGIPTEEQGKIFDRHYRVKSTNKDIKGWGLGLFIIQQIVKAHSSIIKVRSQSGKGSCFYFDLDIVVS